MLIFIENLHTSRQRCVIALLFLIVAQLTGSCVARLTAINYSHYWMRIALFVGGEDKIVGFHHGFGMICVPTGASQLLLRLSERPNGHFGSISGSIIPLIKVH